jgi:hypothetical protein
LVELEGGVVVAATVVEVWGLGEGLVETVEVGAMPYTLGGGKELVELSIVVLAPDGSGKDCPLSVVFSIGVISIVGNSLMSAVEEVSGTIEMSLLSIVVVGGCESLLEEAESEGGGRSSEVTSEEEPVLEGPSETAESITD